MRLSAKNEEELVRRTAGRRLREKSEKRLLETVGKTFTRDDVETIIQDNGEHLPVTMWKRLLETVGQR